MNQLLKIRLIANLLAWLYNEKVPKPETVATGYLRGKSFRLIKHVQVCPVTSEKLTRFAWYDGNSQQVSNFYSDQTVAEVFYGEWE